MSSTPVTSALLQQLDATLQLLEALSSSLSPHEILAARRSLLEAYVSMGQILILRNLETDGVSFVGEFHDMSPDPAYPGSM